MFTDSQLRDLPYRLDWPLSAALCQRAKAQLKDCYRNAIRAAGYTAPAGRPLFYVEGFTDAGIMPVEHGWLELDGQIVDPTLPLWASEAPPRYYFAAYKWTIKQAIDILSSHEAGGACLPIFARYKYTADFIPMAEAHDRSYSFHFDIDPGLLVRLRQRLARSVSGESLSLLKRS